MSVHIPSNIIRGSVVRAYIPHSGTSQYWPRNLLILGFVFEKGSDRVNGLMTARFSFNDRHFYSHDIQFPSAMLNRQEKDRLITLRTNRIDIVPLTEEIFGGHLKMTGYVDQAEFWARALPALEKGLQAEDAEPSLFYTLHDDDRVYEEPSRDSTLVQVSTFARSLLASDQYDRALREKIRQDTEARQAFDKEFQALRATLGRVRPAVRTVSVIPDRQEIKGEPVSVNIPWWKQNPDLYRQKIAEAADAEKHKKARPRVSKNTEKIDLSGLAELFGVSVSHEGDHKEKTDIVHDKVIKPVTAPAIYSKQRMKDHALYFKGLSDIFFDAFHPLINPAPGDLPVMDISERGRILKIKPLISTTQNKPEIGIVWNIYRDKETLRLVGIEMIPCRRKTDAADHAVEICDPMSGQKNGYVASLNERFLVPLTDEFVLEKQPQMKPLNPVFLTCIEEALEHLKDEPVVYGVMEIPHAWEKWELESARVSEDDIVKFQQFQMTPEIAPKPLRLKTPEIL